MAIDLVAAVGPGHPALAGDGTVIIVVASVAAHNARVWLLRLVDQRVAVSLIRAKAKAVVRRLDSPPLVAHPIVGVPAIVPGDDYVAFRSNGCRGHPLRFVATRRGVAVEDDRCRPGGAVVARPNVEDVALVT